MTNNDNLPREVKEGLDLINYFYGFCEEGTTDQIDKHSKELAKNPLEYEAFNRKYCSLTYF